MSSIKPVQLGYKIYDPSTGLKHETPILFLHGITASKEYWHDIPQIVADATNRKVYALDARNHGDSEWSDELDFDANTIDLLHFIEEIKAQKVILVGHSMGGMTVMKTALKIPEKVEKIVVEDMKIGKISPDIIQLLIVLVTLAKHAIKNLPPVESLEKAFTFIQEFIYNSLPENLKTFIGRESNNHRIILKQDAEGNFSYKANMDVIEEVLKQSHLISNNAEGVYQGPSCFIYGVKSPFLVKEDEAAIKQLFPNAEFVGIEDAFHGVHQDCPKPFTEELLKFLNK